MTDALTSHDMLGAAALTAAAIVAQLLLFFFVSGRSRRGGGGGFVHGRRLANQIGRVTLRVPPGGAGAVTLAVNGARVTLPARAADSDELLAGREVVVVDVIRSVAIVAPLERQKGES